MDRRVGIVGIGIIGTAMMRSLVRDGFEVVGYGLSEERWRALPKPAGSPPPRRAMSYTSTATGHLFRLPSLRTSGLRISGLWLPRLLRISRLLRSSGLWIPRLLGTARLLQPPGLWIPEQTAILSLFRFR
jgi:hypothetical protein